jgi:PEGA domain
LLGPVLDDSTPVKLRIGRTVSSAEAQVGDNVDLEVLEEVKVGDVIVIPKGGTAIATVTEAQPKRRMGRGGKLNINIDYVRLADGEKAALRAVKDVQGGGHAGAMTGAIVATSLVFFPAAPLFLFMHGKDITIPKGTEVTAFVNGTFPIQLAKFQPAGSVSATQANMPSAGVATEVNVTSNPSGADIEIDGKFIGNTPSATSLAAGEHVIAVKLAGYSNWQRTITAKGGRINISVSMEKPALQ